MRVEMDHFFGPRFSFVDADVGKGRGSLARSTAIVPHE